MKNKILIPILLFILIIATTSTVWGAFDDVLDDPTKYNPTTNPSVSTSSPKATETISKVLSMVSLVGIAVSVVMLAALGLKYMFGSVEEKAEYKKSLFPYLIGAMMLFGITSIAQILVRIGEGIANL